MLKTKTTPLSIALTTTIFLVVLVLLSHFYTVNKEKENSPLVVQKPPHNSQRSPEQTLRKTTQKSERMSIGIPLPCPTCGEKHHPSEAHITSLNQEMQIHPDVRHLMSRDEKNVTKRILEDGTEIVSFNGTFGHMSAAITQPNGTVKVICTTSEQELVNSSKEEPIVK